MSTSYTLLLISNFIVVLLSFPSNDNFYQCQKPSKGFDDSSRTQRVREDVVPLPPLNAVKDDRVDHKSGDKNAN